MTKLMLGSGLLLLGIASIGILRATNNRNSQNDGATSTNPINHHQAKTSESSLDNPPRTVAHQDLVNDGTIQGTVVDSGGNAVEGMEVVIGRSLGGMLLNSTTNSDGYFSIKELEAGEYEVFTKGENDTMWPSSLFYSGGLPSPYFTTVTVVKGEVTPGIVLQVPPKIGKLIGRVFDAETNDTIQASLITLRRTDSPDYYYQTRADERGSFVISVPLTAIAMEVESGGYKSWTYVNPSLPIGHRDRASIKLRSGESLRVNVGLSKYALGLTPGF